MAELKPCPFCGGEAELKRLTDSYALNPVHIRHDFRVVCTRCDARGRVYKSDIWQGDDGEVHIDNNGALEAIEAWNRRAGEQDG